MGWADKESRIGLLSGANIEKKTAIGALTMQKIPMLIKGKKGEPKQTGKGVRRGKGGEKSRKIRTKC